MQVNARRRVAVALAGLVLGAAAAVVSLGPVRSDAATPLAVTTASDLTTANPTCANPCSLRQAITDANAGTGDFIINLDVAGPFNLTNASLKINGTETSVTINGALDGSSVVHQDGTDRVLLIEARGIAVTLSHLTLTGGHAIGSLNSGDDGYGGAIDINSGATVTLIDNSLVSNTADNGGGAIDNNTTGGLSLLGTTVSGNTSGLEGGGVDDNTIATLVAINSTFQGNTATTLGGGAIAAITAAKVTLVNDTITGNTSSSGAAFGAVQATGTGASSVANTIVSGNTGNNCAGTVTDGGNNLEQGSSCGFATNAQHGDPLLGPLQNNGGPTKTMALDPGSPAIFAGSDAVCTAATNASTPGAGGIDQRGANRPQGTHCDIGAFEVVATTTTLLAPTTALAGQIATLTAIVTPKQLIPGAASGTVSFYDGTTLLATVTLAGGTTPPLSTSSLTAGAHSYTAKYAQTPLFLASTSAAATLNVATPVPKVGAAIPWVPAGALVGGGLLLLGLAEARRRR